MPDVGATHLRLLLRSRCRRAPIAVRSPPTQSLRVQMEIGCRHSPQHLEPAKDVAAMHHGANEHD